MATTTKLKDFLGRWLNNDDPGTSNATDFLGRGVIASNKDFVGRGLAFDDPADWAATTAYDVGDYAKLAGGELVEATVAGTSDSAEPDAPAAVGGTVEDGTATWKRIK